MTVLFPHVFFQALYYWALLSNLLHLSDLLGEPGTTARANATIKAHVTATRLNGSGEQTIAIALEIPKDWYIFASPTENNQLRWLETRVNFTSNNGKMLKPKRISFPKGILAKDGMDTFRCYEGRATIFATIVRENGDISPMRLDITFHPVNKRLQLSLFPGKHTALIERNGKVLWKR